MRDFFRDWICSSFSFVPLMHLSREFRIEEIRFCSEIVGNEKIIFLSTPQNYSDLKILLKVGVPAIKVGSDDFNNTPLIKKYAKTKLPLILSSGMANMKEIKQTLKEVHYKKYPVILFT